MRALFRFALVLLALPLAACGNSVGESCRILCEKSAECDAEAAPIDACVETCKALAKDDDAYAEGVDRRADCYEDVEPACNQLATCDYAED